MKKMYTTNVKSSKIIIAVVSLFILVGFANSLLHTSPLSNTAAVPQAGASYGNRLGQTVHDSVLNIRANVSNSLITHADVLAIMCIELPSFDIDTCSSAQACGLTQVTGDTFTSYVNNNAGGCGYLRGAGASDKSVLRTNPRLSIETGACIYNDLLKRYGGNRHEAYRAYNAGPGRRNSAAANRNANTFETCRGSILQGNLPAKSSHNPSVWSALMTKVSQLTGGTFKTDDAQHVPIAQSGWPNVAANPQDRLQQIARGWFANSGNGQNPIASFLGIPQQSLSGVPQTPSGYLNPNRNSALNPANDSSQRTTNSSVARNTVSPSGSSQTLSNSSSLTQT
ncbi:MAG: lytic transglycosylase domain-containing protein, partial [Candidatus Pacebacteria bacterium]|nr:lytic transglycosylase domain-containing protein [Candidatus Paceibacterota bacterium]